MSACQGIGGKKEAIGHKEPGKEQVPLPPHGQPLGTGNRRPGRKGPSHPVGVPKDSGCIELLAQDGCAPLYFSTVRLHRPD